MSIIDPTGYFSGDRFEMVSDEARLYWPSFWLLSNTCGRFEVNYRKILNKAFSAFKNPPSEEKVLSLVGEYRDARLLFLYECDGQVWGQWDTDKKFLPRHKLAADAKSPDPDPVKFEQWRKEYVHYKASKLRRLKLVTAPNTPNDTRNTISETLRNPSQDFASLRESEKSCTGSEKLREVSQTCEDFENLCGSEKSCAGFENLGENVRGVGVGGGIGGGGVCGEASTHTPSGTDFEELGADEAFARLYTAHPVKGWKIQAQHELFSILSAAVNAKEVLRSIEESHAVWCGYWRTSTDRRVGLQMWLSQSMYLEDPTKGKARDSPKHELPRFKSKAQQDEEAMYAQALKLTEGTKNERHT